VCRCGVSISRPYPGSFREWLRARCGTERGVDGSDDSGARKGNRHIKGGRQEIRTLLYMATLGAATRHNPIIKAHYQRLRAKGKPAKVALIACMRKLIVILNTMLARGQKWDPSHCPAAVV
jgi:transposase